MHETITVLDLEPATSAITAVVQNIREDQLRAPTPCEGLTVGDLLDHVDGLSLAFTAAAAKTPLEGTASADGARLTPDWRTRIPARLSALAEAWRDPAAWTGMTAAGGVEMPGQVTAWVTIDEVLVHGWDLAVATGQRFEGEQTLVEAARAFVAAAAEESPEGTPGLFGPPVPAPADAGALEQLLALTGRDPGWRPPS